MFLGGIYKINEDGVMQFNILTTDPNDAINDFHHRMPVIVPFDRIQPWLRSNDIDEVYDIATPYQEELVIYECDGYVDSGRHDGPKCMAPKA